MSTLPKPTEDTATVKKPQEDLVALGIDTLIVVAMATIGHFRHYGAFDLGAVAMTALPFWTGTLIAHVSYRPFKVNPRGWVAGLIVWAVTWGVGHAGRLILDETNALPFVLTAGSLLFATMVGWRLVYLMIVKGRQQSPPTTAEGPDHDEKSSSSPQE